MTMLKHALDYAAHGWAVLPLHGISDGRCTCGNPDCRSAGKHPLVNGGCHAATTDSETIQQWWRTYPAANIGIATGKVSGLIVVDVDAGEGKSGFESLAALEQRHAELPESLRVRTGSGGLHIYLAAPRAEIRGSAGKLGANIDIRGEGGLVVAPLSRHMSGSPYSWRHPLPDTSQLSKTPDWLTQELISPRPANTNTSTGRFMSKGQRNNDLTSLAGFLRHKGLSEEEIFESLQGVNSTSSDPVSVDEVAAVSRSVARYELGSARSEMHDLPQSRDVAEALSDSCRYVDQTGWKVYDGRSWVQDVNGTRAKEQIKCQFEALIEKVKVSGDPDRTKAARAYLSNAKINAVMDLLKSDPSIQADVSDFDAQSGVLNLLNGTLDLSTGELMPHDPADLLTRLANVEYDPSAECPNFDAVLAMALPAEHQKFLLRYLGYALLGDPQEQVFVVLHGTGANGKSTLINAVSHLLGTYTANVEPATLIKQKGDRIRSDIARLKGVHLAVTSELAMGEILDAPLVKRLTGRDMVTARMLYGAEFEFKPKFALVMATNALPVIDGGDAALARRLILLPFASVVPEHRRDPALGRKLEGEASGILNRLLQGLREYREIGRAVPQDLKAALAAFVASSDMLSSFLEVATERVEGKAVGARELYRSYRSWCESSGIRSLSEPQFRQELLKKDYRTKRLNTGNAWSDLQLRRAHFY